MRTFSDQLPLILLVLLVILMLLQVMVLYRLSLLLRSILKQLYESREENRVLSRNNMSTIQETSKSLVIELKFLIDELRNTFSKLARY